MWVPICHFTSGGVKTCLCLETSPVMGTQFSIQLNSHTIVLAQFWPLGQQVPSQINPGHGSRVCMEQTPLPTGALDGATLHDLKVSLETGHPMPAGLSSRERVQARAFSLIWIQSSRKLPRVPAKVCGRRGNSSAQGPCYGPSSHHRTRVACGVARHLQSSVRLKLQNRWNCLIFKDKYLPFPDSTVQLCCCSKVHKKKG